MNDALTLAIETSCPRGSVALARGGEPPIVRTLSADRRHAGELLPTIADLLGTVGARLADVGLVAFSHGPGSFTGLRVAATIARTLHSAGGCTVVAVPTLAVIARNALALPECPPRVAVLLDARRGQVFGGWFERAGDDFETREEADLREPAAWLGGLPRPLGVVGDGLRQYADVVAAAGVTALPESCWDPRAEHVLALGRRLAAAGRRCRPEEITPLYIRPPACEEVYEQRRAEARRRRGE
ncbi:MAG: tRNA (adenosine(37)-N6)-threonylcarbamoyltransferase complex dimerization subunit type 1 TsaB [Phycisphaerae bacterium]|jgi:tRNA threonylcarbamoyladenosine biosynthesis protein TsaB